MDGRRLCLIIFLTLSFSVCLVLSIQCYQCNSFDDPGCADFFDNTTYGIRACPEGSKYCRKVVQQAYYEGAWHMRYVRQCAKEGELDAKNPRQDWSCYDQIGTFRVKVKYCHCKVDGCNTAPSVSVNKLFLIVPVLLLLVTHLDIRHYVSS